MAAQPHKARDRQSHDALHDEVFRDYLKRTPRSRELYQRATATLAGGVSGNLRHFSPYPLYITSAEGSRTTDMDGNEYIDCFGANGPLLLGHNHPLLAEARNQVMRLGALPLNPEVMVECAELVQEIVPCAERIRFLNTGTEAVMTAVRIARAFTGKSGIVKFHGHYHGQDDQFLIGIDNSDAVFSAGVPSQAPESMRLCRYLDLEALEALLVSDNDIAAVILDPAMHAGGLWGSDASSLSALRELTQQHDVLLIFDEVISGFRLAPGGAQQHFGVAPDLVTMAKALAAGEKLSLVAGKEEVMAVVDPTAPASTPRVFQSGTVNDGPVPLASALAALREYRRLYAAGEYKRLENKVSSVAESLEKGFRKVGIPCQVNQLASMLQIHLGRNELTFETAVGDQTALLELFYLALLNQGVMLSLPTSNHIYFSFAHSKEDFKIINSKIEFVFEHYNFGPQPFNG